MSTGLFIKRFYYGILYFFILTAFVMVQAIPAAALLPVMIAVAGFSAMHIPAFQSGYLSVIHSVCRNE